MQNLLFNFCVRKVLVSKDMFIDFSTSKHYGVVKVLSEGVVLKFCCILDAVSRPDYWQSTPLLKCQVLHFVFSKPHTHTKIGEKNYFSPLTFLVLRSLRILICQIDSGNVGETPNTKISPRKGIFIGIYNL